LTVIFKTIKQIQLNRIFLTLKCKQNTELEGMERTLKFRRGGGHFKYIYIGWGQEVILLKNPPTPGHF